MRVLNLAIFFKVAKIAKFSENKVYIFTVVRQDVVTRLAGFLSSYDDETTTTITTTIQNKKYGIRKKEVIITNIKVLVT